MTFEREVLADESTAKSLAWVSSAAFSWNSSRAAEAAVKYFEILLKCHKTGYARNPNGAVAYRADFISGGPTTAIPGASLAREMTAHFTYTPSPDEDFTRTAREYTIVFTQGNISARVRAVYSNAADASRVEKQALNAARRMSAKLTSSALADQDLPR
ncbi:hypothetical protein ACF08N_36625 [Streptomyces sp. NPDC015127]|uniref:hypothetical protein n=1 Tax=Streptomyces sp. NPDC015127 TaxID=3364939 RepID=UPI0036FA7159